MDPVPTLLRSLVVFEPIRHVIAICSEPERWVAAEVADDEGLGQRHTLPVQPHGRSIGPGEAAYGGSPTALHRPEPIVRVRVEVHVLSC